MFYRHCFSTLLRIFYQESERESGGLELNGTHQHLVYGYDGNTRILRKSKNAIKKNKKALLNACKEIGLEENAEKIK
jgi:hypothetical protein